MRIRLVPRVQADVCAVTAGLQCWIKNCLIIVSGYFYQLHNYHVLCSNIQVRILSLNREVHLPDRKPSQHTKKLLEVDPAQKVHSRLSWW